MMLLPGLMIGGAVLGGFQGYNSNKIKQIQAKTQAKVAKLQAKSKGLELNQSFNATMANNMVVAAAQNRRGGSVQGIARATEDEYLWDLQYAEFQGDLGVMQSEAEAKTYGSASHMAMGAGLLNAGISGVKGYQDANSVGSK